MDSKEHHLKVIEDQINLKRATRAFERVHEVNAVQEVNKILERHYIEEDLMKKINETRKKVDFRDENKMLMEMRENKIKKDRVNYLTIENEKSKKIIDEINRENMLDKEKRYKEQKDLNSAIGKYFEMKQQTEEIKKTRRLLNC